MIHKLEGETDDNCTRYCAGRGSRRQSGRIALPFARDDPAHALREGLPFLRTVPVELPGVFYFNELWESQSDLDAHARSKHFTETFGKARQLLKVPMEVNILEEVK